MWIHCEMRALHDKNIQPNVTYREVLTTQLSHLVSFAEWLSVGLRTKWLWVRVPLQSLTLNPNQDGPEIRPLQVCPL